MPRPSENRFALPPASARRTAASFALLIAWLLLSAWGFWLMQGREAFARAQSVSDPIRVSAIEAWGAGLGAGRANAPLLALMDSGCGCTLAEAQRLKLVEQAAGASVDVRQLDAAALIEIRALLPTRTELMLFNPQGRLLFAGPADSTLHCSEGTSLAELVLSQARAEQPPLWAPVIDEPCACAEPTRLASTPLLTLR